MSKNRYHRPKTKKNIVLIIYLFLQVELDNSAYAFWWWLVVIFIHLATLKFGSTPYRKTGRQAYITSEHPDPYTMTQRHCWSSCTDIPQWHKNCEPWCSAICMSCFDKCIMCSAKLHFDVRNAAKRLRKTAIATYDAQYRFTTVDAGTPACAQKRTPQVDYEWLSYEHRHIA